MTVDITDAAQPNDADSVATETEIEIEIDAAPGAEFDDEIGDTLMLGDDSDCETCGSTYNQVEWSLDEDNNIRLISSIGCYGGQFLDTADLDEAAEFITTTASRFSLPDKQVSAAVATMRERVTAHRAKAA